MANYVEGLGRLLAGLTLPDGSIAPKVITVDANGDPAAGGGGGGGGAVSVSDGADVTQGAKADAAWSGTGAGSVVALLKALYGKLAAALSVAVADGADVTQGAKADAAWGGTGSGSVVALLKALWTALTGTLSIAGPASVVAVATFTRPANTTAYATAQLVANATAAGSVVPLAFTVARQNAGTGAIRRARLSTNKTGLAGTEQFRLHLFKTSPTPANGDGGTYSVNGIAAVHIGIFDFTLDRVFSDGAKGIAAPAVGGEIIFDAAAGSQQIFGLLEARGTYSPASGEIFTVALETLRD
jgi:hypothetical protein